MHKGLFNYSAQTTVLQAVAWVLYVAVVLTVFLWPRSAVAPTPVPAKEQS
jgi:high-affinity iron transporter